MKRENFFEKEDRISLELNLPGMYYPAYFVIRKNNQQSPNEGDLPCVRGVIFLSATNKDGDYLHQEIEFGVRCHVASKYLHGTWGKSSLKYGGSRYKFKDFYISDWNDGYLLALEWVCKEIKNLEIACQNRYEALMLADNPESNPILFRKFYLPR